MREAEEGNEELRDEIVCREDLRCVRTREEVDY